MLNADTASLITMNGHDTPQPPTPQQSPAAHEGSPAMPAAITSAGAVSCEECHPYQTKPRNSVGTANAPANVVAAALHAVREAAVPEQVIVGLGKKYRATGKSVSRAGLILAACSPPTQSTPTGRPAATMAASGAVSNPSHRVGAAASSNRRVRTVVQHNTDLQEQQSCMESAPRSRATTGCWSSVSYNNDSSIRNYISSSNKINNSNTPNYSNNSSLNRHSSPAGTAAAAAARAREQQRAVGEYHTTAAAAATTRAHSTTRENLLSQARGRLFLTTATSPHGEGGTGSQPLALRRNVAHPASHFAAAAGAAIEPTLRRQTVADAVAVRRDGGSAAGAVAYAAGDAAPHDTTMPPSTAVHTAASTANSAAAAACKTHTHDSRKRSIAVRVRASGGAIAVDDALRTAESDRSTQVQERVRVGRAGGAVTGGDCGRAAEFGSRSSTSAATAGHASSSSAAALLHRMRYKLMTTSSPIVAHRIRLLRDREILSDEDNYARGADSSHSQSRTTQCARTCKSSPNNIYNSCSGSNNTSSNYHYSSNDHVAGCDRKDRYRSAASADATNCSHCKNSNNNNGIGELAGTSRQECVDGLLLSSSPSTQAATTVTSMAKSTPALRYLRPRFFPVRRKVMNVALTKYKVIRTVAAELDFDVQESETDLDKYGFNLCWSDTVLPLTRLVRLANWQRTNHFPAMYLLCRKSHLGRTLAGLRRRVPRQFNFYPRTWMMRCEQGHFRDYLTRRQALGKRTPFFIMKPNSGCQGRGIIVTRDPVNAVEDLDNYIVQEYISRPLLIEGRKFDLRVYVLLIGIREPSIFMFNDGLVRMCAEAYHAPSDGNAGNSCMHLTNYAVNKLSAEYVYNTDASRGDVGNKRNFRFLNRWLAEQQHDVNLFWQEVGAVVAKTILAAQPQLSYVYNNCFSAANEGYSCFEILGFDVLVDSKARPLLMEVNHTPSFATDTPLDMDIKHRLLTETCQLVNCDADDCRREHERVRNEFNKRNMPPWTHHHSVTHHSTSANASPALAPSVPASHATTAAEDDGAATTTASTHVPRHSAFSVNRSSSSNSSSVTAAKSEIVHTADDTNRTALDYQSESAVDSAAAPAAAVLEEVSELVRGRRAREDSQLRDFVRVYPSNDAQQQRVYDEIRGHARQLKSTWSSLPALRVNSGDMSHYYSYYPAPASMHATGSAATTTGSVLNGVNFGNAMSRSGYSAKGRGQAPSSAMHDNDRNNSADNCKDSRLSEAAAARDETAICTPRPTADVVVHNDHGRRNEEAEGQNSAKPRTRSSPDKTTQAPSNRERTEASVDTAAALGECVPARRRRRSGGGSTDSARDDQNATAAVTCTVPELASAEEVVGVSALTLPFATTPRMLSHASLDSPARRTRVASSLSASPVSLHASQGAEANRHGQPSATQSFLAAGATPRKAQRQKPGKRRQRTNTTSIHTNSTGATALMSVQRDGLSLLYTHQLLDSQLRRDRRRPQYDLHSRTTTSCASDYTRSSSSSSSRSRSRSRSKSSCHTNSNGAHHSRRSASGESNNACGKLTTSTSHDRDIDGDATMRGDRQRLLECMSHSPRTFVQEVVSDKVHAANLSLRPSERAARSSIAVATSVGMGATSMTNTTDGDSLARCTTADALANAVTSDGKGAECAVGQGRNCMNGSALTVSVESTSAAGLAGMKHTVHVDPGVEKQDGQDGTMPATAAADAMKEGTNRDDALQQRQGNEYAHMQQERLMSAKEADVVTMGDGDVLTREKLIWLTDLQRQLDLAAEGSPQPGLVDDVSYAE